MLDAAVDDVHRVHARLGRVQRRRDFRQHAARNRAVLEHLVDLARRQIGHQVALLVLHAGDVGHHDQLFGLRISAILPATTSALMLYAWPSCPKPIGEMMGMKASSCSALTTAGLIASISPTKPMSRNWPGFSLSGMDIFFARIRPPSLPVRPTAWPP